jgi:para-aminobenzoate synthetase component I
MQMLNWLSQFNICCFLDNQQYDLPHHRVECMAGAGAIHIFKPGSEFFGSLNEFTSAAGDWVFGHFSYDCKNFVEDLSSSHFDGVQFPDYFLFVPKVVLQVDQHELSIGVIEGDPAEIYQQIRLSTAEDEGISPVQFQPRISKAAYISIVEKLRTHIRRGDCYEVNFCQEFHAEASVNFPSVYRKLTALSPNPYSAFYRVNNSWLACASPERFLQKSGSTILSQPIKGTAARNHDAAVDSSNKHHLERSKKEQAENVMIVDLVRNDLSKICQEGTVQVDELMRIYSFPHVHQMTSTISGKLRNDIGFGDTMKATFPMGSMTGAPKKKVMELVETYEQTKRGIFSGTVGYITPDGDFDFNVVIRSLMYNAKSRYLSYQVGSAITYNSDPDLEYEECLLKASAILQVFQSNKKGGLD